MNIFLKILLFLFLIFKITNSFSEETKIKIGILAPLSGENASLGKQIINSIRMALIDINDNKEGIKLKVNGEMGKVSVDKLLNEFDNFSQDFITGNQLKGELSSVFSSTVTIPNNEDFDLSHMEFNTKNKYHQFKLIELDSNNYFVDTLPVEISIPNIIFVNFLIIIFSVIAFWIPMLIISRMEIVKVLKIK